MPDRARRVSVPDAGLEVEVRGSGEPVVLIQTAVLSRPPARSSVTPSAVGCWDLPALLAWGFAKEDADRIGQPVLSRTPRSWPPR